MKKIMLGAALIVVLGTFGIRAIWYYPLFRRPPVLEMISDLPVMVPYFRISGSNKCLKRYFIIRDDRNRAFPNPEEIGWSKWDNLHEIYLGQQPGHIKIFVEEKWLVFRKRTVYAFEQTNKCEYIRNQQFMFKRYLNDRKAIRKKYSVMFIGDSLTEGYFASDKDHGYASLVFDSAGKKSAGRQSMFALNGTSIRGYETDGNKEAIKNILKNKTDVIILELGTNDFESTPIDQFKTKYSALLNDIQESNPNGKIICLGVWRGYAAFRYDEIIFNLAREKKAVYIYLGDLYENSDYHGKEDNVTFEGKPDWFHPSDKGHAEIARRVLAAIASLEHN